MTDPLDAARDPGQIVVRGRYVLADPAEPALVTDGAVLVRVGTIEWVGPAAALEPAALSRARQLDLVMPGFVDAHHHAWARTPASLGCADRPLEPWLVALNTLPAAGSPRLAALASSVRLLRAGVTSVLHSDGAGPAGDYEAAVRERIEGYRETGQRVAFAVGYFDQQHWVYAPDDEFLASLPDPLRMALAHHMRETAELSPVGYADLFARISGWLARERPEGRIRAFVGPLAPIWASQPALEMMAQLMRDGAPGLHTHFLESIHQRRYADDRLKMSLAAYMARLGLLDARTSLAHGVWLSDADMRIVAETGATVAHNPGSNLRLRNGIAPVLDMLERGVHIALGQDGCGLHDDDDFLGDARFAWNLHFRPGVSGAKLRPEQVFGLMYAGGARALGLEGQIGRLAPGMRADLVGLSLGRSGEPIQADGPGVAAHVLRHLHSGDVRWVMVDGAEVVRDGRCLTVDEDAIVAEIQDALALAGPIDPRRRELFDAVEARVCAYYGETAIDERPYYQLNGA